MANDRCPKCHAWMNPFIDWLAPRGAKVVNRCKGCDHREPFDLDAVEASAASVAPELASDGVTFGDDEAAAVVTESLAARKPRPDPRDVIRAAVDELSWAVRVGNGRGGGFPTSRDVAEALEHIVGLVYELG